MTLPTTTNQANGAGGGAGAAGGGGGAGGDDDSDMFGPPRCSPPMGGYHHHRSRVPMISPKLRQREERKRILQLCAHKLERIKDSESNLRRSVCINNTYCRLTDELRREKQLRYFENLPKPDQCSDELSRENIFQPMMDVDEAKPNMSTKTGTSSNNNNNNVGLNGCNGGITMAGAGAGVGGGAVSQARTICSIENQPQLGSSRHAMGVSVASVVAASPAGSGANSTGSIGCSVSMVARKQRQLGSNNLVNDLEILDRELSAINAPMPLIDPEMTQGAEQLEKAALSSRKRRRSQSEDESDRLVREALSQFYIPPQRLISAIEDCPLDVVGGLVVGGMTGMTSMTGMAGAGAGVAGNMSLSGNAIDIAPINKRGKVDHLELVDFDMNQNQKEFEVIMDALRLGSPSPASNASDSCGQAAMMSESASVYHNLVVTSLET